MRPGSIRGKGGSFSIFRIPNFLFEPRGSFLGERVGAIDVLNRIRSVIGTLIVAGMIVYYDGLSHLGTPTTDATGQRTYNLQLDNPEARWFVGVIVTIVVTAFLIPLVSLGLVAWARSGARKATLYQLRWPVITAGAFFGLLAALPPTLAGVSALAAQVSKLSVVAKIGAYLFTLAVAVIVLVWLVKTLYLCATGLFRADDGHPLLAVFAAPVIAASASAIMGAQGDDGLQGVSEVVKTVTEWGGTASILALSVVSWFILRAKYPHDFPFRNGPLRRTAEAPAPQLQT
ncbi:hypothetical protein ACPPVO_21545 [Dactylosporangium sp. McL0621]|uniref:hypothetical protein n=1 Tax=Dactylosporangium sp. McL0621 TaxID=3415678 RepID=UPI003CF40142